MPLSIVHLIEASATGTLTMASLLANAQAEQGHRVHVVYSERPETPADIHRHFGPRVTLSKVQMLTLAEKLLSIHRVKAELAATDVAFLHSSFAGFIGRVASLGSHRPKLFYIPHCISFMRRDIGVFRRLVFIMLEWIGAIKSATYIACSLSEMEAVSRYIPFRPCLKVENAIRLDHDLVTTAQRRSKSVVTVGQIREQKGPNQFATVAERVISIDPEVEFIWIGDGDPIARARLEKAGVTVLGWLQKPEVVANLLIATAYLSTARWEGMPVSLIEANYCGLPVIASRCAGNIDVVDHGKTGWIFETTEQAVTQVLNALNDPLSARMVAERARQVARVRFATDRYIDEMSSLLGCPAHGDESAKE